MIACMGGWCCSRDRCANYYAESKLMSERLCGEKEEVEPMWAAGDGESALYGLQVSRDGSLVLCAVRGQGNASGAPRSVQQL